MQKLAAVFLLVWASSGHAAPAIDGVLSSGLCAPMEADKHYAQPQSTAGYAATGKLRITKQTDTVPLKPGISFGFTWRAQGLPPVANIVYLVEHPLLTRPDGKKMRSFTENLERETQGGVMQTIDCYELSEPHELVAGNWSLTILHKGKTLAKRTFKVIADRQPTGS